MGVVGLWYNSIYKRGNVGMMVFAAGMGLALAAVAATGPGGEGARSNPAWSPDGRSLVYDDGKSIYRRKLR